MYTIIFYRLNALCMSYRLCDIYLTCEADIKIEKMYSNRNISNISSVRYATLKEAQAMQSRIRFMVDRSENKIAA